MQGPELSLIPAALKNTVITHRGVRVSEPLQICVYPQISVTATSSCYKDRSKECWVYLALTLSWCGMRTDY